MSEPSGAGPSIDWERLARAETHHLRVSVLELLAMDGGRELSPMEMSLELQTQVASISYHVTGLRDASLIEMSRTRPARGAVEHFYRLAQRK